MPCLCVSPLSGFSSPTLRRPHLSSPPAYRICCLLTLVHLQFARFPRRCPEAGQNSTASGLSLKPITTNTVCSLGHRRRPNPLSYCCVGGITCVDRLVSPGTATLGRVVAEGRDCSAQDVLYAFQVVMKLRLASLLGRSFLSDSGHRQDGNVAVGGTGGNLAR